MIVEGRRCTVQFANGRLYLDALASPATVLLGHDSPPAVVADEADLARALSALDPAYRCVALLRSREAAFAAATRLAGDAAVVEDDAFARSGGWLGAAVAGAKPAFVVIGDALSAGAPFAALLARRDVAGGEAVSPPEPDERISATSAERAAGVLAAIREQNLLQHGTRLEAYLRERLESVRASHGEIAAVEHAGLSVWVTLSEAASAAELKRRMCERGVLVGADARNRIVIAPPLVMRFAEVDVITGAMRGALSGQPTWGGAGFCPGCEAEPERPLIGGLLRPGAGRAPATDARRG
jgi:4-aminobutyrate aminotransferase-like enzyme